MDLIFWNFLLLYQIFFSPQVKRNVIISNKHGIYEFPHKLPNNLRLKTLEITKIKKISKIHIVIT